MSTTRLPRISRQRFDRLAGNHCVAHAIGRRGQRDDRLAFCDQCVRRNMIAGNQIDLAAEQCRLGFRRAVAECPIDLDADPIPETGFVEYLPKRQVRMRTEECVDLDRFVVGSMSLTSSMQITLVLIPRVSCLSVVIPDNRWRQLARSGIQAGTGIWIPASAGMTIMRLLFAFLLCSQLFEQLRRRIGIEKTGHAIFFALFTSCRRAHFVLREYRRAWNPTVPGLWHS